MLLVSASKKKTKDWTTQQPTTTRRTTNTLTTMTTTTTTKNETRRNKSESIALRATKTKRPNCIMYDVKPNRTDYLFADFFLRSGVVLLRCESLNDTTPIIIRSRRELLDATELFIAFFGLWACAFFGTNIANNRGDWLGGRKKDGIERKRLESHRREKCVSCAWVFLSSFIWLLFWSHCRCNSGSTTTTTQITASSATPFCAIHSIQFLHLTSFMR